MKRLKISTRARKSRALWGRFGGGWNWVLGLQLSGFERRGTLILNLLVRSFRLDWDFRKIDA
jgi:hypothetical protein